MPSSSEWSLVIAGGGSGGHLFPALAVLAELQRSLNPPAQTLCLTAERGIESRILANAGIRQISLPAAESGSFIRRPLHSGWALCSAVREASGVLKGLPAPVVLGTGGFGSLPGVLAAAWLRRPIVLLEQNLAPGRATSLLCRFSSAVLISFDETRRWLPARCRVELVGNPVRRRIAELTAAPPVSSRRTLLVLGGSQGAAAVNRGAVAALGQLASRLQGWTVCHQSGNRDEQAVRQAYESAGIAGQVAPFFDDLPVRLRETGLAITRAGATSLAELACAGVPAILIPFPHAIRDHQLLNARSYAERGAGIIIEEGLPEQFASELTAAVRHLLEDEARRSAMSAAMHSLAQPGAAQAAAEIVLGFATRP